MATKKFSFQNQRVMLTYKHHIPKEEFIQWIEQKLNFKTAFIRLAHETGDETNNYFHSHVVIDFGKRFQTTNERYFDYKIDNEIIHPNISPIKNIKAFDKSKEYIAKEDKDNSDLIVTKCTPFEMVQNCNTVQEALNLAKSFNDANGIVTMFTNKNTNLLSRYNYTPELEWQKTILEEIKLTPDSRTINWIVDIVGNSGKTALAKYLIINHPNEWYIAKDMGTSRDAATIIAHAINSGWNAWGIIIDLPRTAENHERIYSYIEDIKDGLVTTQKYAGKTIAFDSPHVYVMANWLPKIHCLSEDRWNVRELGINKTLKKLNLNEIKEHNDKLKPIHMY